MYLRKNAGRKTLAEMSKELEKNDWVISKQLRKMGITVRLGKRILPPETEEFKKDLENPALSNSAVGRKYGVNGGTIRKWREEKYGNRKLMVDTYLCKSTAEMSFEDILSEMDLAYLYEQKIGKWKVDYDLGFHLLVEIQGHHWHDEVQKTIEKDKRKFADLKKKGYLVLTFWDDELKDKEKVISTVKNALRKCTKLYFDKVS